MSPRITGRKEKDGRNVEYRIGRRKLSVSKAVEECKKGRLPGYHVIKVRGRKYLRDNPDRNKKDNINSQPLYH